MMEREEDEEDDDPDLDVVCSSQDEHVFGLAVGEDRKLAGLPRVLHLNTHGRGSLTH